MLLQMAHDLLVSFQKVSEVFRSISEGCLPFGKGNMWPQEEGPVQPAGALYRARLSVPHK